MIARALAIAVLAAAAIAGTSGIALRAQAPGPPHHPHPEARVPLQPLAQQTRRLATTLTYLGQPLGADDVRRIDAAVAMTDEPAAVSAIEAVLDRHALAVVTINPESRVKVEPGAAAPHLVEGGTRLFLVKVVNQAGVTAPLRVSSPNSGRTSISANAGGNQPEPPMKLTMQDVREKWATIEMYDKPPMRARLSGLPLEYQLLEIYSRDAGQRAAEVQFDVGQGSQDIGFRNDISIVFTARPARPITLRVHDENGRPAMSAFLIKDAWDRIYPSPAKRLAPDFPFQHHVYRADGEAVRLPDGKYRITYGAGPEYMTGSIDLVVGDGQRDSIDVNLKRWIDLSKFGWYSGDHHIHAAGCSHYQNPTQGVEPADMMRQVLGEALNVGSVLTWGPCYYYQKQFFSGRDHELSRPDRLLHYDLEVSGFPSSHNGHLVLLGLKDQDYPGTKRLEDWPSWNLPILKWGQSQGAVVGFTHSGWGLEVKSRELPNHEMPGFDGIGANEYIVDVTHGAVDIISAVDTPYVWELNIWYHTLNVGFRTRISGETDFPCIYDDRVGLGRSYVKVDGGLTYDKWIGGVKAGRSYVSDGRSHLMEFTVNGTAAGSGNSEIAVAAGSTARVAVKVAAFLDPMPNDKIRNLRYDEKPYWDLERARIGNTRNVPVELIVNGQPIARKDVAADGTIRDVMFDVPLVKSSWIAVRILPSSHTNPIFALVDRKPIRASRRSAEWCLAAVNQCWTQKAPRIRPEEQDAARKAYDHAREVYQRLIAESPDP